MEVICDWKYCDHMWDICNDVESCLSNVERSLLILIVNENKLSLIAHV